MRQLFLSLLMMLLPVAVAAQDNVWEQQQSPVANGNPDAKYLAGAVPEVDGRVVFETVIQAPGKTKNQIYDLVYQELKRMLTEPGQLDQSRIVIEERDSGRVVGSYQEWLVFKNKPLYLDRTRLLYHLVANCQDGQLKLQMMRIIYIYDEERNPTTYKPEEWIPDRWGHNRKQTKLARVSGKFRRKTIDRKDYLFRKFEQLLNN